MTAYPWESHETVLSWHGTVSSALATILEQGLGAPIPGRKVSLTPYEEIAVYYASQRAVAPDGGAVLAYEVPVWIYERSRHGDMWAWEVRAYPMRLGQPVASYSFDLDSSREHLLAARTRDEARGRHLSAAERAGGDGVPDLDPIPGTLTPLGAPIGSGAQMARASEQLRG